MVVIYQRLTVTTEQAVEIKFILFIWYEQDDKMNKITVRELRHMNHAWLAGYSRMVSWLFTHVSLDNMFVNTICFPFQTARWSALLLGVIYGKQRFGKSMCAHALTGLCQCVKGKTWNRKSGMYIVCDRCKGFILFFTVPHIKAFIP